MKGTVCWPGALETWGPCLPPVKWLCDLEETIEIQGLYFLICQMKSLKLLVPVDLNLVISV